MNARRIRMKPIVTLFLILIVVSIIAALLSYRLVVFAQPVPSPTPTPTPVPTVASTNTSRTAQTINLPTQPPEQILGVEGNPSDGFSGIGWQRLAYTSCGPGKWKGKQLQQIIQRYHKAGIRVLLTICQGPNDSHLIDLPALKDAAQGNADAVQCGNEEMKNDPSVAFLYIPPENFAKFYDACEKAIHAVRSDIPVLLGSLDPHVSEFDIGLMQEQADYLDQVQDAMDNTVRPGSSWNWHDQRLGLINSWHDGYPDDSVNNLAGLFSFWAQQFNVDVNSGQLGQHLWVVEGTGCFKGCGVNADSAADVATAHILALTTDVQTAMKDKVPFFYFSGRDFKDQGYYWPIGILDGNGHNKPLRQDLAMGARRLTLSCANGQHVTIQDQETLLAKLYSGCVLPTNYVDTLKS